MMPIGDDNASRKSIPFVTYGLILINILFFILEMQGGEELIQKWAFIPSRFLANPAGDFLTLFSAMFMHAGLLHLGGNMLYLWIFGDNVEDDIGKIPYLIFYIVCGIAATFSQVLFDPTSSIPNVGASGAIAGVLGAYILMFPHTKVNVLLGRSVTPMPAIIVIGLWFVLQFMSGVSSMYSTTGQEGGVAYMAHIGGFVAGVAIAFIYTKFIHQKRV